MNIRLFHWEDDILYLRTNEGFTPTTLEQAAAELDPQPLTCLVAKRAVYVHPTTSHSVIIRVGSDEDADWCERAMSEYYVHSAIKWSPEEVGGSLFFRKRDL